MVANMAQCERSNINFYVSAFSIIENIDGIESIIHFFLKKILVKIFSMRVKCGNPSLHFHEQ